MVDASNDLLNGIKSDNRILIESIEEKHEAISKFVFYSLRYLNKLGYQKSTTKTVLLFHIITNMDKIVDALGKTGDSDFTFDDKNLSDWLSNMYTMESEREVMYQTLNTGQTTSSDTSDDNIEFF